MLWYLLHMAHGVSSVLIVREKRDLTSFYLFVLLCRTIRTVHPTADRLQVQPLTS